MPSVVLVTGAGRPLGGRVAARLAAEPGIDRVLAVDTVAPPTPRDRSGAPLGGAEFVRADLGHPLIARVLDQARVDTVVDLRAPARTRAARQVFLDACEQTASLTRFVAESSTSVYAAGASAPAVFTEQSPAVAGDDLEGGTRALARARPDVTVSTLRLAEVVGPGVDSALLRLLALPVVPTALGYDPRLQVLHVSDAVDVLVQAAIERHPGPTNVAGDGVVTLTQAVRWSGRLRAPVASTLFGGERDTLRFGRVVDTTRCQTVVGFVPSFSTTEALLSTLRLRPPLPALAVAGVQRALRILNGTVDDTLNGTVLQRLHQ